MGRLIEAEILRNAMMSSRIFHANTNREKSLLLRAEQLVENAPTAFDVETVVKALKKESVKVYGEITVIGLNKAIEIVRKGGVINGEET